MIELGILGLLKERPMHGYQLSRELSEQLGGLSRMSYGSLYPTLRRLERDGAIEPAKEEAGRSRRKTVYAITPSGEALLMELLEAAPADSQSEDARFRLRLAFFRYLSPETRIRQLERRRAAVEERLATIKGALGASGAHDDYQRSLMEHGRAAAEADIAWLNGLIHRERTTYGITAPVGERRRATATLRRKERTA